MDVSLTHWYFSLRPPLSHMHTDIDTQSTQRHRHAHIHSHTNNANIHCHSPWSCDASYRFYLDPFFLDRPESGPRAQAPPYSRWVFLIEFMGQHWFAKLYRFQVYNSTKHHQHTALCAHHPKQSLLSSSCSPSWGISWPGIGAHRAESQDPFLTAGLSQAHTSLSEMFLHCWTSKNNRQELSLFPLWHSWQSVHFLLLRCPKRCGEGPSLSTKTSKNAPLTNPFSENMEGPLLREVERTTELSRPKVADQSS